MTNEQIESASDDLAAWDPDPFKGSFVCPHCNTLAQQSLRRVGADSNLPGRWPGDWSARQCFACSEIIVWRGSEMVWPRERLGPEPHPDTPTNARLVYQEARQVSGVSRKSAAGLLRLALQILIDDLEPGRSNLDGKIGALVKRGLDPEVQQAMDVLRVIGNNAVHPGQIDLDEYRNLVPALFELFNLIVDQMITRPKKLAALYAALPESSREGVARRDGATS